MVEGRRPEGAEIKPLNNMLERLKLDVAHVCHYWTHSDLRYLILSRGKARAFLLQGEGQTNRVFSDH